MQTVGIFFVAGGSILLLLSLLSFKIAPGIHVDDEDKKEINELTKMVKTAFRMIAYFAIMFGMFAIAASYFMK